MTLTLELPKASTELDESDEARWLQLRVKGQSIEEVSLG